MTVSPTARLDCSDVLITNSSTAMTTTSVLDINPEVECTSDDYTFLTMATIAVIGFLAYAFIIPAVLFCRMRSGVKRGGLEDPEFLASAAWVVLKYRPARWYFEFPLLAYKIFMIITAVLLSSAENARYLLAAHFAATCGLLALVLVMTPFATPDSNKLQVVASAALLATYAAGGTCLALEGECDTNPALEVAVILFEVLLFVGVILYGVKVGRAAGDAPAEAGNTTTNPTAADGSTE